MSGANSLASNERGPAAHRWNSDGSGFQQNMELLV